MHATINEPFVLSSYDLHKDLPRCTGELNQGPAYVYSTFSEVKNLDGYTTITVHGDGVHVLDVSTLHPVATHTLGPATTFSCPAVSSTTSEDGTVTYAVIESSSELDSDESGRTIWMWRHHMDGDSRKKQSAMASHKVSSIFLPKDLPSRVVLLSSKCDLSVTDADLTSKSTLQPWNDRQVLLKSFIFSRSSCSFLPSRVAPTQGSIFLLIFAMDDEVYADIIFIGEDDEFVRLSKCRLPLDKESTPGTISSISCSDSGHLSVLTRRGSWYFFQLEPTDDTINVTTILEPIHLTSLSALTPGSNAGPSTKSQNEITLLALRSTFVLLAGVTRAPSREIVLLLWDLQYSVVLATHTIPIPSTLSQTDKKGLTLELVAAGAAQAILVLTPTMQHVKGTGPEASSSLRSTVLVVPFTVPAASTIANAIGLASHSKKWLLEDESSPSAYSDVDPTQLALLQSMRAMIKQNRPEGASTAFFEWSKKATTPQGQQPDIALGHEFVKELLDIVLQPAIKADIPYSSKVLQFLLSRRAVSASMVEGGLLHALKLRNDWQSISLALDAVSDIPEVEIVALLQSVVAQHRNSATNPTDDVMQIDSTPSDLPSLANFLSSCVLYATSPAPLRLAIRQHLPDAEDLICVLEALSGWVARAHSMSIELLPTDVVKNARGVTVAKPLTAKRPNGPPLEKVLSFLQTLLDSSFLTLLQHSPSHDILRRIASDLEPELTRVEEMEQLRGPLEPFARAQMKALREGIEGRKDGQVDWRKRRKAANAQTSVAVGLYRLEELVI